MISHEQKKDALIKKYMQGKEFHDKLNELRVALKESEQRNEKKQDEQITLL